MNLLILILRSLFSVSFHSERISLFLFNPRYPLYAFTLIHDHSRIKNESFARLKMLIFSVLSFVQLNLKKIIIEILSIDLERLVKLIESDSILTGVEFYFGSGLKQGSKDWSEVVRDFQNLILVRSEISKILSVLVRAGPRFLQFFQSWSGP